MRRITRNPTNLGMNVAILVHASWKPCSKSIATMDGPLSLDGRLRWQRVGGAGRMQLFQDQPLARHALEEEPLRGGIQYSDPPQRVPEELLASDAHEEELDVAHTSEVGRA